MSRNLLKDQNAIEDEFSIRPNTLSEYVGQKALKSNLDIFIKAARQRNEMLDHVLLYGPPGLGKTTLAHIIANEMKGSIITTSGPAITKKGDLVAILASVKEGDLLFIDEIHRLNKQAQEILYPAMEDYCIDIVIGKDAANSRIIHLDLPPFTLIGATTRTGDLSAPMRDRFGITAQLQLYSNAELKQVLWRTANLMNVVIDEQAVNEIAKRSRGTPRIVNRIFRRIRDFGQVYSAGEITYEVAINALKKMNVNELGLDQLDLRYLRTLLQLFDGGPIGIDALASAISEETNTLEDVYEPFLLNLGFILRTSRGRIITNKAKCYLSTQDKSINN